MEPKSASFRETSLTFPTPLFACGATFIYMNNESKARRPQPTAHRKDSQTLGPMRPRAASESLARAPGAPGWRPQPRVTKARPAPTRDRSPGRRAGRVPFPATARGLG